MQKASVLKTVEKYENHVTPYITLLILNLILKDLDYMFIKEHS